MSDPDRQVNADRSLALSERGRLAANQDRRLDGWAEALQSAIDGEARFDNLARTLYATDASFYEIIPAGVVLPRHARDVATTVDLCREHGISIVARGAGTGLTGGALGTGVQIDLSRYMNGIGPINVEACTVEVEPGVVLDDLNAALAPHGLRFGPDVATASRATIGGMIANNACGARSIVYGRTVDHIAGLAVVLSDGRLLTFGDCPMASSNGAKPDTERAQALEQSLGEIRDQHAAEIQKRFPKILRSNGGYGLDRLGPAGTPAHAIKVLSGSEGTLGIVVRAKLNLVPTPKETGIVVLHYDRLRAALDATPDILAHEPAAVELIDRLILQAGAENPALARRCSFLQGDPEAILVVEFFGENPDDLATRMNALKTDKTAMTTAVAVSTLSEKEAQKDVWAIRKSGLGLLMSKPGRDQPYGFVEDTAVDPAKLGEYIDRFTAILNDEGVTAGYYAHASVGCLHIRPVVNLHDADGVDRMRRIAEGVTDLAISYGGTMTGEHGDGLVRSCWLEKLYGPKLMAAFKAVKDLFDPIGLLNPHKIVDAVPMTDHLRFGPSFQAHAAKTHLDFDAYGGPAGLAGMCTGVGQCRQRHVGTMCPSYMATQDETHTTRARANALRVALSNRGLLDGLDDRYLADVLDLCLSCKACKTECPTGVDMAKLKSEYLAHRNLAHGAPARARLVADLPRVAKWASRLPRLSNLFSQSRAVRAIMERRYGLDRRIPPPRFARKTFRAWYRRHRRQRPYGKAPRGRVIYFVDTWTNYFAPETGIAAVRLLEQLGYAVLCPRLFCCGRPAISKGLLTEARDHASFNIAHLAGMAASGVPIVGTEPSCILTLVDEYPQLVRTAQARMVADRATMIESLLARLMASEPDALRPTNAACSLLYHGHCHQKALVGTEDAVALMRSVLGSGCSEIGSGCCGMAGSFGHEREHYEVARAVGEERLFPAVRGRGDRAVAVSGFSCRQQIDHHTDVRARHLIEYIAEALI